MHQALLYRADEDLLEVAVPFLREGAEAGEPTLVRLDARQQQALLDELDDLDGITELEPDHYRDPLSALQTYHRLFGQLESAGAGRIRLVGAAPHDPWRAWFRYVAATNDLFAPFPVLALCPHDARTTPDDVLVDIERTHPYLVCRGGRVVRSRLYEQPAPLLYERARAQADPLEAMEPDVFLGDPEPERAGRAAAFLANGTRLEGDSVDALRLSVTHVVRNAFVHGRPPVVLRAWGAPDRVVALVTDAGRGPADPYVALLPRDPDGDPEDANSLHVIHHALSDLSMFTDADGFTVRLVERCPV